MSQPSKSNRTTQGLALRRTHTPAPSIVPYLGIAALFVIPALTLMAHHVERQTAPLTAYVDAATQPSASKGAETQAAQQAVAATSPRQASQGQATAQATVIEQGQVAKTVSPKLAASLSHR